MPITRRKRANPPDQPENNHHQTADQTEGAVEQPLQVEPAPASPPVESVEHVENPTVAATAGETQASPENPLPSSLNPGENVQAPLPASNGDRSAASEYIP